MLCPVLWDFLEIPEVFLKEVTSVNSWSKEPHPAGQALAWVPQTLQPYIGGTLPLASTSAPLWALYRCPVLYVHSRWT